MTSGDFVVRGSDGGGAADDDIYEEDLRRAIALSLQPQDPPKSGLEDDNLSPRDTITEPATTGGASFGVLTLDRQKMEADRLARMKRKTLDTEHAEKPRQRAKLATPHATEAVSKTTENRIAPSPVKEPQQAELKYAGGAVKRTWALGYPRHDDIKIEEVLQKNDLELAVLSSYQWDDEWLLSKLDLRKTKVICVAYAVDDTQVGPSRILRQQLHLLLSSLTVPRKLICVPMSPPILSGFASRPWVAPAQDACTRSFSS